MLEIDGSRGEGGGQMVRTSVALSVVTGITAHLTRIRENRPTNGLSKQHCAAISGVAEMTGSEVEGNFTGSSELVFRPGKEEKNHIELDIGTAGSISLVLQAILLAARNHRERLTVDIIGGTNVLWAPPIDSYQQILFPLLDGMGIHADVDIRERGFYPRGGGHVIATQEPIKMISPTDLSELGDLISVRGICFTQNLSDRIGKEIVDSCKRTIKPYADAEIDIQSSQGDSRGAGISLVANFENGKLGSNGLTTREYSAEKTGEDAAKDLIKEIKSGATVDIHTADQMLPYMAMADGKSRFKVSNISRHLLSQMDTLETFLDVRFGVERKDDIYHFTVNPGAKNETLYSS
ncbi:MAG TPA: RNA 3'-terminal phosphate cyclase [Candidatus Methanomethylophilaceae archaeon]|nr:RNA 3'-terminal phosphate cyclase [Candidatus Methanomethylophilaceae archaeon]